MNWGFLIINLIMATALFLELIELHTPTGLDELPPSSAGITSSSGSDRIVVTPAQRLRRQGECNDVVFRVSQDDVKYVREAGGGRLFAAFINNNFGLYQLDSYGHMMEVENYRIHADVAKKLRYALSNCNNEYFPAGTFFPGVPLKEAGKEAAPDRKASVK